MGNEKSSIKKLRQRFVKDYSLPINIFEEKYFEYYRSLYPFFPNETWEALVANVSKNYNGNVESWLDYCAKVIYTMKYQTQMLASVYQYCLSSQRNTNTCIQRERPERR